MSRFTVHDLAGGKILEETSGYACALSPDGQWAVSASDDKTLKEWDMGTGHELRTLLGHTDGVWAVTLTVDGQRAVSPSAGRTLKLWDLETAACLATFTCDGKVYGCAYSESLRTMVAGDAGGTSTSSASKRDTKDPEADWLVFFVGSRPSLLAAYTGDQCYRRKAKPLKAPLR